MDKELKLPFYAKASLSFIGLYTFISILYIGQDIIVPLIIATILAIILNPSVNYMVKKRINRVLAIIITLALCFLVIASFATFLYSQVVRMSETWPQLVDKLTQILHQISIWASQYLNISPSKVDNWLIKTRGELINTNTSSIGSTLMSVGNVVIAFFLLPVYIFMILFYEPLLLDFIRKLFGKSNNGVVGEIITEIKTVIQRYLIGLLIEAVIIAVLFTAGLLLLGIEYAIIFGILGALLNMIPYVGAIIAAILPMMVALATKSSPWFAVLVLLLYIVIQFIDNNYIVPKIVASKVKINALVSMIVVVAFGALWGISGMFLSIPLIAIIKLIFDHIEPLKHWGFLLGDTMPALNEFKKAKED